MKKIVTAALVLVFCSLFGFGVQSRAEETVPEDQKIPANVHIGDLDVGGMTAEEAMQELEEYQEKLQSQEFILTVDGNQYSASMSDLNYEITNAEDLTERAVSLQSVGNLIQLYKAQEDLKRNDVNLDLETSFNQEALENFINTMAGQHNVEAQNASVTRGGSTGFVVTPSVTGKTVDVEAACEDAVKAMKEWDGEGNVEVTAEVTEEEPEITTEDMQGFGARLGSYTTHFNADDPDRTKNLAVACGKLNGRFIEAGGTFDLYDVLGPFTTGNGYLRGHAYENGQVVDSIGGGVCQVSTTMYVASLYAELTIVERYNHSMTVAYVPYAWDATIASGGYKTLVVRNDTGYPIYITASANGGNVTVEIYGKETRPANRQVQYESRVLSGPSYLAPVEVPDPNLPEGQRVQTSEPYPSVRAQLIKNVFVDGVLQSSEVLNTSSYRAVAERISVGTGQAESPEEPEETTTKEPETTKEQETTATEAETTKPSETKPSTAPTSTPPATTTAPAATEPTTASAATKATEGQ